MNGQITEVKQSSAGSNTKMGDHLGPSLAMIGRNIRQISQIFSSARIGQTSNKDILLPMLVGLSIDLT